jgi:hypothetical protein
VPYALEGDEAWIDRWQRSDGPGEAEMASMRGWLDGLRTDPRQHPSAMSSRDHPHAMDELRGAVLLDAGPAFVVYAVDDTSEVARVLHIGADPPPGMTFGLP